MITTFGQQPFGGKFIFQIKEWQGLNWQKESDVSSSWTKENLVNNTTWTKENLATTNWIKENF